MARKNRRNKKKKKINKNIPYFKKLGDFLSEKYKYLIAFLFLYFISKSLYFIFTIPFGVAPDEVEHFGLVELYKGHVNLFEPYRDLPLPYGRTATMNGFLYHLLMGKLLWANFFTSNLIFLRVLNLALATANVFVFYKFTNFFTSNKLIRFFLLTIYTNIIMFTFISSAVNYDNLVNLLGVCTIYVFIKFVQTRKFNDLALLALLLNIGVGTKTGYWPLAIIVMAVFFLDLILSRYPLRPIINEAIGNLKSGKIPYYLLYLGIVLIIVFNSVFLFGKIDKFGRLDPYCEQLYTEETCHAEDEGYSVYEELSERFEASKLRNKELEDSLLSVHIYAIKWYEGIIDRAFGIFGHRVYIPDDSLVNQINLIFLWAAMASVFNFKFRDKKHIYTLLIGVGFALLLMIKVNYQSYLNYGLIDAGLQSRYLFPAWSALILCFGISITGEARSKWMKYIIVLLCIFFIYSEFPQYLMSDQRAKFEAVS